MIATRVGYTGGSKVNPSYHSLGDHTEALEITYDPDAIGYSDLLEIFWQNHNPFSTVPTTQYQAAVFYHDQNQREHILHTKQELEKNLQTQVQTKIAPADIFYQAEDYHQKFYLQNTPELVTELKVYYNGIKDLINSTAAARINGYAAGHGTANELEIILPLLGLSTEAQEMLKGRVDF